MPEIATIKFGLSSYKNLSNYYNQILSNKLNTLREQAQSNDKRAMADALDLQSNADLYSLNNLMQTYNRQQGYIKDDITNQIKDFDDQVSQINYMPTGDFEFKGSALDIAISVQNEIAYQRLLISNKGDREIAEMNLNRINEIYDTNYGVINNNLQAKNLRNSANTMDKISKMQEEYNQKNYNRNLYINLFSNMSSSYFDYLNRKG